MLLKEINEQVQDIIRSSELKQEFAEACKPGNWFEGLQSTLENATINTYLTLW